MIKELEYIGYTQNNGLVLCSEKDSAFVSELLYLYEAEEHLGATAIFFRRHFYENQTNPYKSEPLVYIFQRNDSYFNTEDHLDLHRKIWSAGKADIYIILGQSKIEILNARVPATISPKNKQLKLNDNLLISEAISSFQDLRFAAYHFSRGVFWEQDEFKDKISAETTPHKHLLQHLLDVRDHLVKGYSGKISEDTINRLLIITILVKFLEEIKDHDGQHTLREMYSILHVKDCAEAIEEGLFLKVLHQLSSEFNGKIFQLSPEQELQIDAINLKPLADFLGGTLDLKSRQYSIWRLYDFKFLPAEVISAIYENFSTKNRGVVYTPTHLVNLLVDEVMPLHRPDIFENESFTVIDPSCGSGVFLVAAYKRMLQWKAINDYKRTGEIIYPQALEAQRILEKNIFGVDIQATATLVSIFSLTVTLLEKLTPKEIWNNLKFHDLTDNIKQRDFFTWASSNPGSQFDLVIGNPPFNDENDQNNAKISPEVVSSIGIKHSKIPKNDLALYFFEASMAIGKKTCLILKSSQFIYNNSNVANRYRSKVFKAYTIHKILDFTHLRRILFRPNAETSVCAVIGENTPSLGYPIEHVVVKRVSAAENKINFEIDYYDKNWVRWDWATDPRKQFVWKSNLLSGNRLFELIQRFAKLRSLDHFLEQKKSEGWLKERGFEGKGTNTLEGPRIIGIKESKDGVTSMFEGDYDERLIIENQKIYADKPKSEALYEAPVIIVHQKLGNELLPACLVRGDNSKFYFKRDFSGISAPMEDLKEIETLYNAVFQPLKGFLDPQLYIMGISASAQITTETDINHKDILSLPYPKNLNKLQLTEEEEIIQSDVLTYFRHLGKALTGSAKLIHRNASNQQMQEYGSVFCSILNRLYKKEKSGGPSQKWSISGFDSYRGLTIIQFKFGANTEIQPKSYFHKLFYDKVYDSTSTPSNNYSRVIRIYSHDHGEDSIVFIKPSSLRYWLKTLALRDADDTLVDFFKSSNNLELQSNGH